MNLKNKKIYGRFIGQPISAGKLFANLPKTILKQINSIKNCQTIPAGKVLINPGSHSDKIFILVEGQAQMFYPNNLNNKNYSRLIEKEELVGLTEYISDSPTIMKVATLSECQFDIFLSSEFLRILGEEPQICFRLATLLSNDILSEYALFNSISF